MRPTAPTLLQVGGSSLGWGGVCVVSGPLYHIPFLQRSFSVVFFPGSYWEVEVTYSTMINFFHEKMELRKFFPADPVFCDCLGLQTRAAVFPLPLQFVQPAAHLAPQGWSPERSCSPHSILTQTTDRLGLYHTVRNLSSGFRTAHWYQRPLVNPPKCKSGLTG